MAFDPVLHALTDHWTSVIGYLTSVESERLGDALGHLTAPGATQTDQDTAALDVADLLSTALPVDHPVRRAIADPSSYIEQSVMARLLAAPALTGQQLRAGGGDPDQPDLIGLEGRDGVRFPAFQFDIGGRPYRLVLAINRLLDAGDDPWGVADWWLGSNAWLDRPPAECIGLVADTVLLNTARALIATD